MSTRQTKLPPLRAIKPVRFPSTSSRKSRTIKDAPRPSTKVVIAEMKKLSKQGIYISE